MGTVAYPGKVTSGLSKPDVAVVRSVEFEVDFSKVTAVAGDDITIGTLPKGAIVLAGAAQVVAAASAAATYTLRVGTTAITSALTGNAAVGTVVGTALAAPLVATADGSVNVLVGAQPATGKARFTLLVSESIKPYFNTIVQRDQSLA